MEEQPGDEKIVPFSFETDEIDIEQVSCYLTYTNAKTHKIIGITSTDPYVQRFDRRGWGRYCPSIEDKIVRFEEKDRHQVFVEPMGINTQEMYCKVSRVPGRCSN